MKKCCDNPPFRWRKKKSRYTADIFVCVHKTAVLRKAKPLFLCFQKDCCLSIFQIWRLVKGAVMKHNLLLQNRLKNKRLKKFISHKGNCLHTNAKFVIF